MGKTTVSIVFVASLLLISGCDGGAKTTEKDASTEKSTLQDYVEVPLDKAHGISEKSSGRDAEVAKQADELND
jgi:hypothetical protein